MRHGHAPSLRFVIQLLSRLHFGHKLPWVTPLGSVFICKALLEISLHWLSRQFGLEKRAGVGLAGFGLNGCVKPLLKGVLHVFIDHAGVVTEKTTHFIQILLLRNNLNYNTYKMWALKFTLLLALAIGKLVPLGLDDYNIVSTP